MVGDAPAAVRRASMDISRPTRPWRWSTTLVDSVSLLALVWSVPVAVMAVAVPIALAIALVLRIARLALSGF
jgi:hypothetical protein